MEPYPKRQRLYAPLGRQFPESVESQHAFYNDSLLDIDDAQNLEDVDSGYDPDTELQQCRKKLDYKLKSTFEAIFEKYERDFDGVGDEIDLATGDIVVNNGHLLQMQNERDAGDISRAHNPIGFVDESDNFAYGAQQGDTLDEDDFEDDDDDEEGSISDNDMIEDDFILRGFSQANRFLKAPPESGSSKAAIPRKNHPRALDVPPNTKQHLPSRSEIVAQFGPRLGPQVANYVFQKQIPNDSHIEPAWRVPEVPGIAPAARPASRKARINFEAERSPSPEAAVSVWAPIRGRGPRRLDGADSDAIFRGESMMRMQRQRPRALDPFESHSTTHLRMSEESNLQRGHKRRVKFSKEDQQLLVDWAERARMQGIPPLSHAYWRTLATMYPHHTAESWRQRYLRYLSSLRKAANESKGSSSDTSIATHIPESPESALNQGLKSADNQAPPTWRGHPSRVRKPAQRDSRIISWSEAVDAIESLDPDLHAQILKVDQRARATDWAFNHPLSPTRQVLLPDRFDLERRIEDRRRERALPNKPKTTPNPAAGSPELEISDSIAGDTPQPDLVERAIRAPCPHVHCTTFPTILYRVQQRNDENMSEMCLHLFRVHHMTPFPCGENKCNRTGEEGYFTQEDLVCHVRAVHPTIAALHRLRGRVDSYLLDRNIELAETDVSTEASMDMEFNSFGQSDFMSLPKQSSSQIPSSSQPRSSSDADQTVTSKIGASGALISTPMTSVSSLQVNHSSAITTQPRELRESLGKRLGQQSTRDVNTSISPLLQASRNTRGQYRQSDSQTSQSEPFSGVGFPRDKQKSESQTSRPALPIPVAPAQESPRPMRDEAPVLSRIPKEVSKELSSSPAISKQQSTTRNIPGPETAKQIQIPNSQSSMDTVSKGSPMQSRSKTTSRKAGTHGRFARNVIDPSYEFSDDEQGVDTATSDLVVPFSGMDSELPPPPSRSPVKIASKTLGQTPYSSSTELAKSTTTSSNLHQPPILPPVRHADENPSNPPSKPATHTSAKLASPAPPSVKNTDVVDPPIRSFTQSVIRPPAKLTRPGSPPFVRQSDPVDSLSQSITQSVIQPPTKSTRSGPQRVKNTNCVNAPSRSSIKPATQTTAKHTEIASPTRRKLEIAESTKKATVITPAKQKQRKSHLHELFDSDMDELSLGSDDFVLISSHPRTNPGSLNVHVKTETRDTPRVMSAASTRKRKLSILQADDEIDELCSMGPPIPSLKSTSTASGSKVKVEADSTTLSLSESMESKSKRLSRKLNSTRRSVLASSSSTRPETPQKSRIKTSRVGTPLLDLTPSRGGKSMCEPSPDLAGREIGNSVSSPPSASGADSSSPLVSLLTPSRVTKLNGSANPLTGKNVPIVVRVPGGPLKKCGEGDFTCGRSFCFRCRETRK